MYSVLVHHLYKVHNFTELTKQIVMAYIEQPEDFADLLDGSDEEEEEDAGAHKMLDLDSLNSIHGSSLSKSNPILLDMLDLDESEDDEDEEKDLGVKSKAEDDLEVAAKREKLTKILSRTPPGEAILLLVPRVCKLRA